MSTLLLSLALASSAAVPPAHDVVPADLFSLEMPAGIAVDRSGARVAYARSRWDPASGTQTRDLWLLDTRSRSSTRLTFTPASETSPVFAPDGAWIYYERPDDKGGAQIWRLRPDGSQPAQLTSAPDGVAGWELSADGKALFYATESEAPIDDPFASLRAKHDAFLYGHASVQRHGLHRLDLGTWRVEPIHEVGAWLIDFAVSPDQRYVAMLTAPDDALITHEGPSKVEIFDRNTGLKITPPDRAWRADAPTPFGWLLGLAWSDDSRALAFRVDFDGYPGETFVTELALGEAVSWKVPRPREVTAVGDTLHWVPFKRELCQRVADHARERILCTDNLAAQASGRTRSLPEGNVVVRDFVFSGDGRDLVVDAATSDRFPELYRLPARGQTLPVRLTELNPQVNDWKLPSIDTFAWAAPDATPVEGILELPPGWTPDQGPLPTLILIHGGPTAHATLSRRLRVYGETWMASRGWAVLQPNYRGSTSYGDAFITDLVGHENEVEVNDILAGVDALVKAGIADPQRLAVSGWSNGGYLTACLITHTQRFDAAIVGAGVVDQLLQWSAEDTPGHVINFMRGLPWEAPNAYDTASPLQRADRITTPTLIHVGEQDPRVPPIHADALFRALSVYLKVPTERIVYPGAGHGLSTRAQMEAKIAWDTAWLDRYVLGKSPDPPKP